MLRVSMRDRTDWEVLHIDHHEGYLSWHDFESAITDNATSKSLMPSALFAGASCSWALRPCTHVPSRWRRAIVAAEIWGS